MTHPVLAVALNLLCGGVETISLLTCLKLRYPHRVQLVRGNHESRAVTQVRTVIYLDIGMSYGFYTECVRKYGSSSVWTYFTDMFDYLTLSVVIEDRIFCVHGGPGFAVPPFLIPHLPNLSSRTFSPLPQAFVVPSSTLSQPFAVSLPVRTAFAAPLNRCRAYPFSSLLTLLLAHAHFDAPSFGPSHMRAEIPHEGAMADLVWSDPDSEKEDFAISPRGAGYTFGSGVVRKFLETNNMHHILRAHQLCMEGFTVLFDNRLSTVWSAPNYCYRCGNSASILEVGPGETMHFNVFEAAPENQTDGPSQQVVGGAAKCVDVGICVYPYVFASVGEGDFSREVRTRSPLCAHTYLVHIALYDPCRRPVPIPSFFSVLARLYGSSRHHVVYRSFARSLWHINYRYSTPEVTKTKKRWMLMRANERLFVSYHICQCMLLVPSPAPGRTSAKRGAATWLSPLQSLVSCCVSFTHRWRGYSIGFQSLQESCRAKICQSVIIQQLSMCNVCQQRPGTSNVQDGVCDE
ncbi:metallophos domain-containing protein [Rhizoctonia solani AG-1 IA]|uniref:Serine/threonine-protein phosphatase n=1 Tax=Thanatephorus cucumeris (strain AG1-IA) TaxID=983506 RepID=L8WN55_THACA|nr:metallophos domain-containing protein [Rhizoctonia solani AG-1 IA]